MLKHRAIRLSIKDRIRDMLLAPDITTGLAPYNIYYEADFRRAAAGQFTPVFPFIYILDSYLLPVHQKIDVMQPQVIIDIEEYRAHPFELGNRSGRTARVCVYILGQNRGQRDDLGVFFMDYIGTAIEIKDYSAANPGGTVIETAIIDDDRIYQNVYEPKLEIELAGNLLMGMGKVDFVIRPKL